VSELDPAATKSLAGTSTQSLEDRLYLLVFDGGTSTLFHLPRNGSIVIGRGDEADLSLADEAVSRRHARVVVSSGEVRVTDLDSHNGTRVNGERIEGTTLMSGDVITICGATLVLHTGPHKVIRRQLVEVDALWTRLEEELSRASEYERPASVIVLSLAGREPRDKVAERVIAGMLRMIDVAAWTSDTQVALLVPELGDQEAAAMAAMLVDSLRAATISARAGFATYPADGADGQTLIAAARAAADQARPQQVSQSAETARRITMGDRVVLAADPAMVRLFELLQRLAPSDLPVLILGETGAGKENAAYAVHYHSARRDKPFIALNCAALPETLVESELFGYEKGAFSGATAAKVGLLEAASGGTVFLDEIGDLPLAVQAKLLRVLETQRLTRLGDVRERPIDLRIVAATNRDLEQDATNGRFRSDLYFRLSAAVVNLPPLRERPREIPILARAFLGDACTRSNRAAMSISPSAMLRLATYTWPGNVRELKNSMDYSAATVADDILEEWHLPERITGRAATAPAPSGGRKFRPINDELRELEKARMIEALQATNQVQTRAAELIGMPLRTFVLKLKQYGIRKG
jgi:two-component system response regulator AtoC